MYKFFVGSDKAMLFVTPHNFSVTFAVSLWELTKAEGPPPSV